MFLLKRYEPEESGEWWRTFTFHNVSIKTTAEKSTTQNLTALHSTMFLLKRAWQTEQKLSWITLHSTMFLLKLFESSGLDCICLPLHSTMFLLKPWPYGFLSSTAYAFTFHNVSIKTCCHIGQELFLRLPLHSTMFLLKPLTQPYLSRDAYFTFHNVSIKTILS